MEKKRRRRRRISQELLKSAYSPPPFLSPPFPPSRPLSGARLSLFIDPSDHIRLLKVHIIDRATPSDSSCLFSGLCLLELKEATRRRGEEERRGERGEEEREKRGEEERGQNHWLPYLLIELIHFIPTCC